MSGSPITQAERDAMVKRFERSNECRLRPKTLADGWMHNSDVIYDAELERLIEMIWGGRTLTEPTVTIGDPDAHP